MGGTTLLIGAYERENFGDLLFLSQTESYLKSTATLATAPFPGAMKEFIDKDIIQYGRAIESNRPRAVWCAGGEVGGTSLKQAFKMSAVDHDVDRTAKLSLSDFHQFLRSNTGLSEFSSPYLPRMSAHRHTHESVMIINSAGLSGLRRLIGSRRSEAWGAVREARFISVRDQDSSNLLRRHRVPHALAPDLVHTLGLDESFRNAAEPDLALVQVKAAVLERVGTETLAKALVESPALKPFRIRLFSAGSARGHDDSRLYEQVECRVRAMEPRRDISISQTTRPLDKAREIANSGLWIGTSLHGLIISSTFGIPRIGLHLEKLIRYAKTWNDDMPVGAEISEINAAVERALHVATRTEQSSAGLRLAQLADDNIKAAIKSLESAPLSDLHRDQRNAVHDRRRSSVSIFLDFIENRR